MKIVIGAGFLGAAVARYCRQSGIPTLTLDRYAPGADGHRGDSAQLVDLLVDDIELPPGDIVLTVGNSMPRVRHPWTLALDNVLTTARLVPHLAGRRVVLASSIEALGRGTAGLPIGDEQLRDWAARARELAAGPCPPWRAAGLCAELVDPGGRWTYGLAKRAQEILLIEALEPEQLSIVRLANLFGLGQDRVVSRLVRRARAGLPLRVTDTTRFFLPVDGVARQLAALPVPGVSLLLGSPLSLRAVGDLVQDVAGTDVPVEVGPSPSDDVDVAGLSAYADTSPAAVAQVEGALRQFVRDLVRGAGPAGPPLPVVVPPRPDRPDLIAGHQQESLWTGRVKAGNIWTDGLTAALTGALQVGAEHRVLLCASGTAALRLAVVATVGRAEPGDVAVLPSFTFAATGEALIQLGYRLRFVDVDPDTWTLDPAALERALARPGAKVVVAVDTLGVPADYDRLHAVCRRAGVALVADSAPSLGGRYARRPVGTQAVAHAFSMSFAKVVSAGGAGGVLTVPPEAIERLTRPVDWLRSAQLGELNAVVALEQVERLEELVAHRSEVAAVYEEFAASRPGIIAQRVRPDDRSALVHWVARFVGVDRDHLQRLLAAGGVASKPYYAPVLHQHDWGSAAEAPDELPVTEALGRDALALPMSSELTAEDAERVVAVLDRVLASGPRRTAAYRDRRVPGVRRTGAPV